MSAVSHLAMTTFCWLPPDRFLTLCLMPGVLIARLSTYVSAFCLVRANLMVPRGPVNLRRLAIAVLASTSIGSARP